MSPRRGSRGTTFVFSGTSNHRLWPESAPALELFAGATVTSVSPSPGWEEGTLRWEWRADAPDLASMNLSALTELVDVEGRARRERLGSITLDVDSPRSLPAVGRVLLPIDSVLPLDEVRALAPGARLELTVVFDEPLGAGGPLVRCVGAGSVDAIDFEPPTAVGPAWFFRGTVKPGAPQGLCQFAVKARDEVGNEGTRPLSVIGSPSDTSTESGVTEYLIDTVAPPVVHLMTGAEVIGLEIQPALVEAARELAARLNVTRLAAIEGDATELIGRMHEGSVFFFYCPFSGERLDRVLAALEVLSRSRPIRLCCVDLPLPALPWLELAAAPSPALTVYRSVTRPSRGTARSQR